MNILAIGNSFSTDATRYLHDIAAADGVHLEVTNLYIGGCSLERHYRNMLSGENAYELQYDGHATGFFVSLDDALLSRRWDVVTVQQVSHQSFLPDSYLPYVLDLAEHIRTCQPKAKLLLHQTWAYEEGSQRLTQTAGFAHWQQMLQGIIDTNAQIAHEIHADGIIPSGQLFGTLLDAGVPSLHRDTYHVSFGLGRYALGLLWYRMLSGNSTENNSFRPFSEPISEDQITLVQTCVNRFSPIP